MIRYAITKTELIALIDAEKPGWRTRADDRTRDFRKLGFYKESSSIWSEIKSVYMGLQGFKCAYCEREMERVEVGKVDHDIEHFRPKGNVRAWKAPKKLVDLGIAFTPPAPNTGYHLLPYHVLNFAAACKPCNSTLKKDYFPIRGAYKVSGDDPIKLKSEQPYLIFPLSTVDDDPEELIEFYGTSPRPVARTQKKRYRAVVTIEFFKLDDPQKRKHLYRDRAILIMGLFPLLQKTTQGSATERALAATDVQGFLKPELRHLNCARSFERLFLRDAKEAEEVYKAATQFVVSIS